ncbi:MAG: DUF4173 domain-containing protein [candidate division KSB1 bacterium]|nr:DUF4173 domain-containing protein [candidate division KSB1 bacterium]MDZ7336614.1 DUF4173 domain-containing protein [candidate division KSB1 bacterium]MDZ7358845.1 DUF4173 domain-containing protein [candidate division KSB1 bacterium]
MNLKNQINKAGDNAAALEQIYRQALAAGNEASFKEAIGQCATEHPENVLFQALAYRLDILPLPPLVSGVESQHASHGPAQRWWIAVATSMILGVLFAIFAGNRPPVPIPGQANPLFWIGWSPLTALGILFYLALVDRIKWRPYGYAALVIIPLALYIAATVWGRTDDIASLNALHLPFVVWAIVGFALALRYPDPARQYYAYLVKSVETVLVGGIYFGTGAIFLVLTYGIFAALGIHLAEDKLQVVAAWGIGAIPMLALASVYDPKVAPVAQDWASGLTRILRIVTHFILPLAIAVLSIYVFWFVPAYFWRPFQEREVLIVYNATILAILVLLTIVVSAPMDERSPRQNIILRYGLLALLGLSLLLNVYALAAMVSRTFQFGLTPNRYAVLGWNLVTLLMLTVIGIRQWRCRSQQWIFIIRESIAGVSILAVLWAVWVLIGLPLSFK